MATVITSRRPVDPTPEEIAARKAEIRQRHLAKLAAPLSVVTEEEKREQARLRTRANRQRKKHEAANLELLQVEPEPVEATWPPRPLTDRERALYRTPENRREFIQWAWDARKEANALAADADARGVLNYWNINRGPRAPRFEMEQPLREMEHKDIANVEFLQFGELDSILEDVIGVVEAQHEMEDLNCSWNLGPVEPESEPVKPFK